MIRLQSIFFSISEKDYHRKKRWEIALLINGQTGIAHISHYGQNKAFENDIFSESTKRNIEISNNIKKMLKESRSAIKCGIAFA